ncbi:MAG TPA: VOC family protein [Patescibacteria group bacterium]|nr:VOC family protein [Patescibacteria group bacterium]
MSQVEFAPYIFFQGNCAEAMTFYKEVFGGDLDIQKFDTMPKEFDMPNKEEMKDKVMNANLKNGMVVIRGCDSIKASPQSKKIELCLTSSDESKLRQVFDKLGQGGDIKYPLKKEFWGDIFGMLTDKFGVDWIVDITKE